MAAEDRWETRANDMLNEYGVAAGYDRPDVVVFDRRTDRVIAIGEAKYFETDDWAERLRDAVPQIVRYARGYEQQQDVDLLLSRSLIALWQGGGEAVAVHASAPLVTHFDEMCSELGQWSKRALADA